jgi:hypothetical protein
LKQKKHITYHEAKILSSIYNVPKPNLSYPTVLKLSSLKDMIIQVYENDICPQTPVKQNSISLNTSTASAGSAAKVATATPAKSVDAVSMKPVEAAATNTARRRNNTPPKD